VAIYRDIYMRNLGTIAALGTSAGLRTSAVLRTSVVDYLALTFAVNIHLMYSWFVYYSFSLIAA
jgi:hypothetical protein